MPVSIPFPGTYSQLFKR